MKIIQINKDMSEKDIEKAFNKGFDEFFLFGEVTYLIENKDEEDKKDIT